MKLPKDVNQKETRQIVLAEMAWSNFMRSRKIPVIDQTLHNALSWYAILSNRWLGDEAYALQQQAKWDAVLLALANWETKMAQEEQLDSQQKAIYGPLPPDQWADKFTEGQRLRDDAIAAQKATAESAKELQAQMPPGSPPPAELTQPAAEPPPIPPPPLDGFLPEDLGRRIYAVWRRMLPELKAGILALEAAKGAKAPLDRNLKAVELLNQLLQMKGVIEQCRILSTVQPQGPPPATAGAPPPGTPPPMTPPGGGQPPPGGPAPG
jgi:hypothetical protein